VLETVAKKLEITAEVALLGMENLTMVYRIVAGW
jgi:hypothetical protein